MGAFGAHTFRLAILVAADFQRSVLATEQLLNQTQIHALHRCIIFNTYCQVIQRDSENSDFFAQLRGESLAIAHSAGRIPSRYPWNARIRRGGTMV